MEQKIASPTVWAVIRNFFGDGLPCFVFIKEKKYEKSSYYYGK